MLSFLRCLALTLVAFAGVAQAQTPAPPPCPTGTLVIGTDATFPPFTSKVGDTFVGLEIELGEEIARRMGCRVRWVNSGFDGIFPALLAGKFDLVISSTTITEERQQTLRFSAPYVEAGVSIAVRRDRPPLVGVPALEGKRVGVGLNTTGQYLLEPYPAITLVKFPAVDLALADVRAGRLDAAVVDTPALRYMIREGFPDLKVTGPPLSSEQWGMVFSPARDGLRRQVDAHLAELKTDGTLAALEARFLGGTGEPAASAAPTPPPPADASAGVPRFRPDRFVQSLPIFAQGARWTLGLSVMAFLAALPLGLLVAIGRMSAARWARWPCTAWVELLRGTPLLVQLFFIYFVLPAFGLTLGEVTTAVVALSINASAYMAEIFRAGLESLDRGQTEAALALGLTRRQALRYVLVPQAVRRVVPPLTNEAIALIKESSLVSIMGMTELTRTGQELASRYADPLTIWPGVALVYFVLTFPLTRLSARLEAKLDAGRRRV